MAHIRSASIRNFRCLHHVDLDLAPLTVLVGHNASGKSSLLAALGAGPSWTPRDVTAGATDVARATLELVDGRTSTLRVSSAPPPFPRVQALHLDLARLRAACPATERHLLAPDGSELVNVFASLTRAEQGEVAEGLAARVPVFKDVIVRPSSRGHQRLQFQDRWSDRWYEPDEVSDGTILVLSYLLLAYQQPAPDVIAIEEPERGLHPHLLGEIVSTLRELTERDDRSVQVILATHSAELLAHVEPDEVRFCARNETDGGTVVRSAPTDQEGWDEAVRAYENSIGQMWLAGVVGSAPA